MVHNVTVNNHNFNIEFSCRHSKLKDNTCPIGNGDCKNCEYCLATLKAPDYFKAIGDSRETNETK